MYVRVSELVREVTRLKDELQVLTHADDEREREFVSLRGKVQEKEDEVEKLKTQLSDAAAEVQSYLPRYAMYLCRLTYQGFIYHCIYLCMLTYHMCIYIHIYICVCIYI